MRPLRLSMTAFGPYAGTETIDFEALAELGLFVVAGNNGAGKTTIFDALHYSLYGRLPGRRADYGNIRSDHAPADVDCVVVLDFRAKGADWRIERAPAQTRAKRRGRGTTQAPARAVLYRLDADGAVALTNRLEDVRTKCTELVGLTSRQFERVALLPQGEFSRALRESGTDRRELLRTLFSSEIFDDATSLLSDQAAQATTADRERREALDRQREALASELGDLIDSEPSSSNEHELCEVLGCFREHEFADRANRVAELERCAADATRRHQLAVDANERFERRNQVRRAIAEHERELAQHERDAERLARARAAVPVAGQARSTAQQQQRLEHADEQVMAIEQRLSTALGAAGVVVPPDDAGPTLDELRHELETIAGRLAQRREISLRATDLETATNRLRAGLRRIDNDRAVLAENLRVAEAQRRRTRSELERLTGAGDPAEAEVRLQGATELFAQRQALEHADDERDRLATRRAELHSRIEHCEASLERTQASLQGQRDLEQQTQTAVAALERCTQRHQATLRFRAALDQLIPLRRRAEQAMLDAEARWNAYISGTAARVAQALVDDEPCPVCGSTEHPEPARPHDGNELVTHTEVGEARCTADELLDSVRRIEAEVEALHLSDPEIASRSIDDVAAELAEAKERALQVENAADDARSLHAASEQLTAELTELREYAATIHDDIVSVDERRNRILGALGDGTLEPLQQFVDRVDRAREALADATTAQDHRASTAAELAAVQQTIDTLSLERLAIESRSNSLRDQLAQREQELLEVSQVLEGIDRSLGGLDQPALVDCERFEMRARAVRRSLELVAELVTAQALQADANDAVRRARSILDERLTQSRFASVEQALAAFCEPELIDQLEAQTTAYVTKGQRLAGQLEELDDVPDDKPDLTGLAEQARSATAVYAAANRELITVGTRLDRIETELRSLIDQRNRCDDEDRATRRLERVAALVKGDNDRNTSLENWVLAAHLRDVVELANIRLARSTQQRFQLCVLDDGQNRRGTWGLDLGIEDTVTGTRRPTAGLSGGELFQTSLALALGLADAVMNQSSGVHIDALFIDEGFGSLDDVSVERAIDLLDELRDRGAMVGVITHVPALLEALPRGVTVVSEPDGQGSTIRQAA